MKKYLSLFLLGFVVSSMTSCSSDNDDEISETGPDFVISELQGTSTETEMIFT